MYYLKNDDDNKARKEDVKFIVGFIILILALILCLIVTIHVAIKTNNERKQEAFDNPPTLEVVKSDFGNSFFIGDDLLDDYITVVKYNDDFRDAAIYFIIDDRPFLKETRYYQAIYLVYEFNSDFLPTYKMYEWKNADKYIQITEEEYNYYTQTKQNDEEK